MSDPDFLARFRSGEHEVLSRIYCFHVQGVESYIRRGLLQRGPRAARAIDATVADLVQEVFTHAFGEAARLAYDGTRDYGRLLIAITRNTLVDYLRRQNREELIDPKQLEQLLDGETSRRDDESPWRDPRLMELVQVYVTTLPERERAVYVKRYAQNESQLQAADALGLTWQQIRTLEERVRAGLVRQLARAKLAVRAFGIPSSASK